MDSLVSVAIPITQYLYQKAIFRFRFVSDNNGFTQAQTGWYISDIHIGINTTKDYERPIIEFLKFSSREKVAGTIQIQINITDDRLLDFKKIQFWVDAKPKNFSYSNRIYLYTIDTTKYANDYELEISTIAYDVQGNKAVKKLILVIANPLPEWQIWLTVGIILAISSLFIVQSIRNYKRSKLIASGDYKPQPSLYERYVQNQFMIQKRKDEANMIIRLSDKKYEKTLPWTLMCKSCKKWFKSPSFEIYCPICTKDSLYIAKKCYACNRWYFFEDEGTHQCTRCNIPLLKDFEATYTEIQSRRKSIEEQLEIKEKAEHPKEEKEI
jgi:hypothetical protein